MKIFLDIETVPLGEEPQYKPAEFAGVKVPVNYKVPETIETFKKLSYEKQFNEHLENEKAKYESELHEWKKGALKATRSQIVCICAITEKGHKFDMCTEDEFYLLRTFEGWITGYGTYNFEYVGHNVPFDLQMLRSHAAKHKVLVLKDMLTFEKWAKNIHDTMQLWAGVRYDDKTKLTEIAEFLGIGNLNEGTDGSDIYDLYKAGKFDEIETKCLNDVIMCKEVYERIS